MTATVVAENIDLRKSVSITERMLEGYGSTEEIEEGSQFRLVDLFYPLLIESSNDAAEALTYFMGREAGDFVTIKKNITAIRLIYRSNNIKESGFTRTIGTDKSHKFFMLKSYIHV